MTARDLNLAINYFVIEHVVKDLEIYESMVSEHEMIEVLFSLASKGELGAMLDEIDQQPGQTDVLVNQINNLFGLDREIILGEKQIDLGIHVDKSDVEALDCSQMTMADLYAHAEKLIEKGNLVGIPELDRQEKKLLDESRGKSIGSITLKTFEGQDLDTILRKLKLSPLGLIGFSLFVSLIINKKLSNIHYQVEQYAAPKLDDDGKLLDKDANKKVDKQTTDEYTLDMIEDIYDYSFTGTISLAESHISSVSPENIIKAYSQENIYDLDSLIYYIARNKEMLLFGYSFNGELPYHILDNKVPEDTDFSKLRSWLPMPLVPDTTDDGKITSELVKLVLHVTSLGYVFTSKYTKLTEFLSIDKEIERTEEKLNKLEDRYENAIARQYNEVSKDAKDMIPDKALQETLANNWNSIKAIESEIAEIKNDYLSKLIKENKLFKSDHKEWRKQRTNALEKELKAKQEIKNKLEKEKELEINEDKRNDLGSQIRTIDDNIYTLNKGIGYASGKKGKAKAEPIIRIREPYYEEMSLSSYNGGVKRKPASNDVKDIAEDKE